MPIKMAREPFVTVEAIRKLASGSFEHLGMRIDDALAEHKSMFEGRDVARLATFGDRVVVGSKDGKYYSVYFQDQGNDIAFTTVEHVDVPVVDPQNIDGYINDYLFKTVDSLISGSGAEQIESIVALMNLNESIEENTIDLASAVAAVIGDSAPWKALYQAQYETIKEHVQDVIESIESTYVEPKYAPLYDGSIPEDRFYQYLDIARDDLGKIGSRLAVAEDRAEKAFLPFSEAFEKDTTLSKEDRDTVKDFVDFANGLTKELHVLRSHVQLAVEGEQCAMCLGQIHDAIAECLSDYEIASSFVERMATNLVNA